MVTKSNNFIYRQSDADKSMRMPSGEMYAPVSLELLEDNRRRQAGKLIVQTAVERHAGVKIVAPKKPTMLNRIELEKIIKGQKLARPYVVPIPKTWEATKPCADNEDTTWRDPAYEAVVIRACKVSCVAVLQCLEKDRKLGGEPGIRAGKTQSERQELYALQASDETQTILSDLANAIYADRVPAK